MKWVGLVIVAVIAFLVITSKAMPTKDNNSAERMRKLRAIKKKKALAKKINSQKSAGVSQGGNQTQGEAPARMMVA